MEAQEKKRAKGEPILEQIKKVEWDIIILDEAHRIKERSTGWTREIKKLKGKIKHVMTGTGFINNPAEIWSLLHFLNRKEFGSYWRFRETFCNEDYEDGFRRILGINPRTEQQFRALVREVGPRRTKTEVFPNLEHPIYSPVEVDLNPTQRRMYDQIKEDLFTLDQDGVALFTPNVLAALQRQRQVCVATPKVVNEYFDQELGRTIQEIELVEPSSKLDAMMEIIEGLEWDDDRRDQIVVFSNFRDPIKLAKARFEKKGISYIEMKQSDNDRTRYEKWAIEFPKKEHQVFICTLQLGSESISLTSATTCIFLDRSWSPKDNSQGESRVWRPGQESVANMIYINARDTVDERVRAKVDMKSGWFKQIFGDEEIEGNDGLDED
jgi:SNF2 family DNA or RNA helicase